MLHLYGLVVPKLQFIIIIIYFFVVVGDVANIILDPIFIFVFRLNVCGAAIAHVISQ